MGSWGFSLFSNDDAMDLLVDLAEMDDEEKAEHLREILTDALNPSPVERVWPNLVLAAAGIIALALPGGGIVLGDTEHDFDAGAAENAEDEWAAAILREPDAGMVRLALEALNRVTRAGSEWFESWQIESNRIIGLTHVEHAAQVLRRATA
ncbi:DUF4259 domain-containing protein [Dactylosporangium sp. NBC_01737]|uniref:DUF4259 domain-containing protein n=1 Tax=Dactylosporangium sp. NBC_01737 TaxID=2975959 RepID=UPI002E102625|nr:DUF4259 domain-containing protein [Dactylosporangium sp. NBC_01737]